MTLRAFSRRRAIRLMGGLAAIGPGVLLSVASGISNAAFKTATAQARTRMRQLADARWDVIVLGSGAAGLSAAVGAREAGARRVLLLEKGPLIGGHSIYSSGSVSAVSDTRFKDVDPDGILGCVDQFVEDALFLGGHSGDPLILRRIAQGSDAALRWLESMGVRFGQPFTAYSGLRPRTVAMAGNSAGRSYVLALMSRANLLGVSVLMNAAAVGLAKESDGWRVTVEENAGRPVFEMNSAAAINSQTELSARELVQPFNQLLTTPIVPSGEGVDFAAKAVVIATGGFTANTVARRKTNRLVTPDIHTSANPYGRVWDGAHGDGIRLGIAAGGYLKEGFGLQLLPFWGGRLLDYSGGDIFITPQGERFVNESLTWGRIADAILALPEKRFWVITDRQSYKGATLGIKLINGIVKKSDTIDEMARGMGIDPAVLKKTMSDYNKSASAGYDPVFDKDVFTQTIDQPPYYWGEEHIYVHTTLDGLAGDDEAHVVNHQGEAIPGLYAAGEVVGGIFGYDRLGGISLITCFVMGRLAGEKAVEEAL